MGFCGGYEEDEIAIDSEDDKKIKKCEKRAKELVDQRFKSKRQRTMNYQQNRNGSSDRRSGNNSDTGNGFRQLGSNGYNSSRNQGGYVQNFQTRGTNRGECYSCDSLRLYANECPERKERNQSSDKCESGISL